MPDYLEDTEVFEVSPAAELNKVIEVVLGNLGPDGWSCPLPGSQRTFTSVDSAGWPTCAASGS